jgi:general secretion pathway protein G
MSPEFPSRYVTGIVVFLFVALVVSLLWPKYGPHPYRLANTEMTAIASGLASFKMDNGRYPTTAEGLAALITAPSGLATWKGPYIGRASVNDPWGNPYGYVCPGTHNHDGYDLRFLGPSGHDEELGNPEHYGAR